MYGQEILCNEYNYGFIDYIVCEGIVSGVIFF